jgi:hypothetical protein
MEAARVVNVCAWLTSLLPLLLCVTQAVGDELLDSIVSDNIPIFTEEERYNQTVLSSVERIEAKLNGQTVPGGWPAVGAVQAGCRSVLLLQQKHTGTGSAKAPFPTHHAEDALQKCVNQNS